MLDLIYKFLFGQDVSAYDLMLQLTPKMQLLVQCCVICSGVVLTTVLFIVVFNFILRLFNRKK